MNKIKSKYCNTTEKSNTNDCVHEGAPIKSHPPLIAKWRNGVKLQLPGRFDGDGEIIYIIIFIFFFIYSVGKNYDCNFKDFIEYIIIKREIFIISKIAICIN